MTVPAASRRTTPFLGNGVTTSFPFTFKVFQASDIAVVVTATSGALSTKVLNSDYSVTLNADQAASPGGSITYPLSGSPLATGEKLVIVGNLPYSQTLALPAGGNYNPVALERALDRTEMQIQQVADGVASSVRAPLGETLTVLPDAATRANTVQAYDSQGNPIVQVPVSGSAADVLTQLADYTLVARNAALVGYNASLAYSARTVGRAIRDRGVCVTDHPYNAVGDGVADDTAAIQAAINTGRDVFFPAASSYYRITAELSPLSNQRLYGEGVRSQIRQVTSLLNVIHANAKSGVVVENLKCYATGDRSLYDTGAGVLFKGCEKCVARNVVVENHRGGGVVLYNTNDSEVLGCLFLNSPAVSAVTDVDAFVDVAVVYSSSRNVVAFNRCLSGQGTGIMVQTVVNGNVCDDNIIALNEVKDTGVYGIVAYRNSQILADVPLQSVRRVKIIGNTVTNVSGAVQHSSLGTYTYGTGIYLQGAEGAVVEGNTLKNTHSAAVVFAETFAPGAIGATNLTRCTIRGNQIDDDGMFGIDIGDGNDFGDTIGHAIVAGNEITNTTRGGIHIRRRGRLSVNGNTIDTCADSGVEVNNIALRNGITIADNIIRNVTGTAGVEVKFARGAQVNDNLLDTLSNSGITVADSEDVKVNGNTVRDHTVRGIQILSTSSGCEVRNNTIRGTGASNFGIQLDAATRYSDNKITAVTTQWVGNFGQFSALTANSTTPSVADGSKFLTANTIATTISNFTGGYDGQEIFVRFNDANTTLDFTASNLKGNNLADRAMANGDAIFAVLQGANWYVSIVDA